jgi:hypothetical protein
MPISIENHKVKFCFVFCEKSASIKIKGKKALAESIKEIVATKIC